MNFDLSATTGILARTPRILSATLRGLPAAWTRQDEGPGTWSAFDVVGHLIHGERTDWIPRARLILAGNAAESFEPFDRFAQETESRGKTLEHLLDEFAALRRANLATLADWRLTEDQLEMPGRHPEFGRVTLRELLATWTVHDLGHLAQVCRALAARYRDDVGPWRAYLPILGAPP